MTAPLLATREIRLRFGGVQALAGVSMEANRGELVGLIGPNGAGKTTLLRVVSGVLRPDAGRVLLDGADVTGLSTQARVRRGLALTHQIVRPFRSMTVRDNVALAAGLARTRDPFAALLHWRRRDQIEKAEAVLARVGLSGVGGQSTGAQPLGNLKRLEVARALALDPAILLLDEPLAGLSEAEATALADLVVELNAEGVTIVLIEHNLAEVLRICRRLVVLDNGRVLATGAPREVIEEPAVRAAYLGAGGEADAAA